MRHLAKANSEEAVIAEAVVIIERGMELFDPKRRLSPTQQTYFAEVVATRYPNESLADINVFIYNCSESKYDGGEFYSAIDVPRIMKWWTKYLEEKVVAMEVQGNRWEHEQEQMAKGMIENIPGLGKAVRNFTIESREKAAEESKLARRKKLEAHIPKMTDDELRDAYKLYPSAEERSIIMREADRRGLVAKALEKVVNETGVGAAQVPATTQGTPASFSTH